MVKNVKALYSLKGHIYLNKPAAFIFLGHQTLKGYIIRTLKLNGLHQFLVYLKKKVDKLVISEKTEWFLTRKL